MTITLSAELERLVEERVKRGEFDSPDVLVGAAVHRLLEEDIEEDSFQGEIRTRVEAAEAEIDRGEYLEFDSGSIPELARDIHQRGLARLAAGRQDTGTGE